MLLFVIVSVGTPTAEVIVPIYMYVCVCVCVCVCIYKTHKTKIFYSDIYNSTTDISLLNNLKISVSGRLHLEGMIS
jgi:hypothetical protein